MFCNQCEQTAMGKGCEKIGVCGKAPDVSDLQDVLVYQLRGIGWLAHEAHKLGARNKEVNRFVVDGLFATITNVDFDSDRIKATLDKGREVMYKAADMYKKAHGTPLDEQRWPLAARLALPDSISDILKQAGMMNIQTLANDQNIRSLKQIVLYGIKGMAAYAYHAAALGSEDDMIYDYTNEALAALNRDDLSLDAWVDLSMRCGQVNVRCMELLDAAHTGRYGHPVPTTVSKGTRKGPAIVVSGHDLYDLEELLKQTEGKGISIYTHGEMLPAHGYPGLKKYSHLVGHFGTAWQNQQKEFDNFPAAILFNTNCIQKPKDNYKDRVFTCGLVAWPGVTHIAKRDFSPLIKRALELAGFEEKVGGTLLTGCAHNAVLSLAGTVVNAVKTKKIRHFFVIGGCDGAKPGRNYYTDLAQQVPKDCLILTVACGKFRFNDLEFGAIEGIPRLLDAGQCNDAYSLVVIASALAKAFDCGINDLPLSIVLSWYEQKAVVILLSLLSLGIKNIRIGPSLPAFISPDVLNVLVEKFALKPISTPEKDLAEILR